MTKDVTIDEHLLKTFIPMNDLSSDKVRELAEKSSISTITAGRYAFKHGDTDNVSVYLVEGEIELLDETGNSLKHIKGGTDEAMHPLAPGQPRSLSARVVADATIIRINRDLLDLMLSWDSSTGGKINVMEAESEDEQPDDDWMSSMLRTKALHNIPPANIQKMFISMEEVGYKQGDIVIQQGDEGDFFYAIAHGECQVLRESPTKPEGVPVATLSTGATFGEEALISNAKRGSTVKMLTDGNLMRLSKENFVELLKEPLLQTVTFEEARQKAVDGAKIIDVRMPAEFHKWNIKGSMNIPLYALRNKADELDDSLEYIVVCDTGGRSSSGAYILHERGINAFVMKGGMQHAMPKV
ncbi:MAG: cyclic nucleotide-binding domain-containing protein, partial [Gammaproteobacteria bacterium]|nr:cyclic nucleotide-binding domain-containing protein [Gammaproteobacteria bacterium]